MTDEVRALSIGDLVCVREGTHDKRLPVGRTGLIIEQAGTDIYKVWMTNGETLKFHSMFLEVVTEMPKRKSGEKED